ncbi:MAG: ADP-ribosylglycohydrolase family protein [Actinomycetota bacterium]|nr:ADP-ribosylglycohydrolase family protein [Actinomycetota bacterium]
MSDTKMRDRFRGALVGVAVGDALGALFEGCSPGVSCEQVEAPLRHALRPLRYTDDTAMTMGLARSLLQRGGVDGGHLAATFAEQFRAEPWRGYGPGPPRVFSQLEAGVAWDDAAKQLFGGEGSLGNGGAMRVAPAALAAFPDLARTASLAHDSARVTHAHELGMEGAALQACAISLLLQGVGAEGAEVVISALRPHVTSPVLRERLERVASLLPSDPSPDQVVTRLGNGITALEAVPAALAACLLHLHSFRDVVCFAIGLGGDSDTIGAMAGALAGAHHGESAIPRAWRERVEGVRELVQLADELLELVRHG